MGDDQEQLYPCAGPGCAVMRTKAEGGTTFTVCDACWDKLHPSSKPAHWKTCAELPSFTCCACGKDCCNRHGLPVADDKQGKHPVLSIGGVRCTPCSDAGRQG